MPKSRGRKGAKKTRRSTNRRPLPRARSSSGPLSTTLVAMALGMGVALLLVAVAVTLLPEKVGRIETKRTATSSGKGKSPLEVSIKTRNAGGLQLQIAARLDVNGQALTKATAVAYADMASMPGSHTVGPLPMQEVPGSPGVYGAQAPVSMPGEWKVRVEVQQPLKGRATKTMFMGVTSPRK